MPRWQKIVPIVLALLAAISLASLARPRPGQAQKPTVKLPPVKAVLLLPNDQQVGADLLTLVGTPSLITTDTRELVRFVETEDPTGIIIHTDALDEVDGQWLRQQYNNGRVIMALNALTFDLDELIGLPRHPNADNPPPVKPPMVAYMYARGEPGRWSEKGRGIGELWTPGRVMKFLQDVEEASATNRMFRESIGGQ